jgi:hypothetical protein
MYINYTGSESVKYCDYDWNLSSEQIVLDEKLNIDKLGWKSGDCFVVQNIDGRAMLTKVDPLVQFVKYGNNPGANHG